MIIDANEFQNDRVLSTDICIIGAGVAGLTLAKELQGTGRDVCVLEQGGMRNERQIQKALRGSVVGYPYWGLDFARHAQVGGTSHRWFLELANGGMGARFRPMDTIDFEARDEIPYSGWPITRAQLDPYYERAQNLLHLGSNEYDATSWASPDELILPESEVLKTVVFQFGGRTPFSKIYPRDLANDLRTTILTHAHATSLLTHPGGTAVSGVQGTTINGRAFTVQANTVVLALGGIENARLLLLSNDRFGGGLGNEHDRVGRFFMEHPHFMSGVFWPSDPAIFEKDDFYYTQLRRDTTIQGKLALREEVLRREKLRNFCISLNPTWDPEDHVYLSPAYDAARVLRSTLRNGYLPDRPFQTIGSILRHPGRLGRHFWSRAVERVRKWRGGSRSPVAYHLHYFSEQAPNPSSRVRLSRSKTDPFGWPCAELDLQYTADDIQDVLRGQELLKNQIERAGIGVFEGEDYDRLPPSGIKGGFHHMGTTRMHRDQRQGVVDANCRVHGLDNLYVAGSSVFTTGGYANPTLTICALSIRLADHLKAKCAARPRVHQTDLAGSISL